MFEGKGPDRGILGTLTPAQYFAYATVFPVVVFAGGGALLVGSAAAPPEQWIDRNAAAAVSMLSAVASFSLSHSATYVFHERGRLTFDRVDDVVSDRPPATISAKVALAALVGDAIYLPLCFSSSRGALGLSPGALSRCAAMLAVHPPPDNESFMALVLPQVTLGVSAVILGSVGYCVLLPLYVTSPYSPGTGSRTMQRCTTTVFMLFLAVFAAPSLSAVLAAAPCTENHMSFFVSRGCSSSMHKWLLAAAYIFTVIIAALSSLISGVAMRLDKGHLGPRPLNRASTHSISTCGNSCALPW
jgi:hypothetical protein